MPCSSPFDDPINPPKGHVSQIHHTPLSGGDRKALGKELVKSRAMTKIVRRGFRRKRRLGEALIREVDNLACQSWNEKMWSDGPSTRRRRLIKRSTAASLGWRSSAAPRDVDLCALPHVSTTCVHDLASRLICDKCRKVGKRPAATLLQLTPRSRNHSIQE
jgi:hypothetical protein